MTEDENERNEEFEKIFEGVEFNSEKAMLEIGAAALADLFKAFKKSGLSTLEAATLAVIFIKESGNGPIEGNSES